MTQGETVASRAERDGREARPSCPGSLLRCCAALTLVIASYWLLNYSAFPLFDTIWPWNREASAIASGIALTALALYSYWRPEHFTGRRMTIAAVASALLGAALSLAGYLAASTPLLVFGTTLGTVAAGLACIIVGIACMGLGLRYAGIAAVLAYTAAFALRAIFTQLPQVFCVLLFFALPLLGALLVRRDADPVLNQAFPQGTPAEIALTNPGSVLPFEHRFFLTLLLFRFIYGFTLTFGEIERTPQLAFGALIPFIALVLWAIARRQPLVPETLFQLSILGSVAGFLLVGLGAPASASASLILSCGTGCFEMFMYYMLIALGSRNPVAALPVMAWGSAMASWGTLLGANFGRLANRFAADPTLSAGAVALVVFFIVAYLVVSLNDQPFTATLKRLSPPPQILLGDAVEPVSLEQRCRQIGEAHNLTGREQEVFEYLARGRNVRFIEEELVVSYNTVKTHVSHIYAKLGVHSHQELIDFVESNRDGR